MLEFSSLISEFSNPYRIKILSLLDEDTISLTKITEMMEDISKPEVSRHLKRLIKQEFIRKEMPAGRKYEITPIGKVVIEVIKPLNFLFKYFNFFKKHRVDDLPISLIRHLDALENSKYIENIGHILLKIKKYFQIPSEEWWFMGENLFPFEGSKVKKMHAIIPQETYNRLKSCLKETPMVKFHACILKNLPISLIFNSLGEGFIAFPRLDDKKPDFSVIFQIRDEKGINFLQEIWDYFWNMGKRIL
jgi:DNA-binding transcriptional ArsR family regulator